MLARELKQTCGGIVVTCAHRKEKSNGSGETLGLVEAEAAKEDRLNVRGPGIGAALWRGDKISRVRRKRGEGKGSNIIPQSILKYMTTFSF